MTEFSLCILVTWGWASDTHTNSYYILSRRFAQSASQSVLHSCCCCSSPSLTEANAKQGDSPSSYYPVDVTWDNPGQGWWQSIVCRSRPFHRHQLSLRVLDAVKCLSAFNKMVSLLVSSSLSSGIHFLEVAEDSNDVDDHIWILDTDSHVSTPASLTPLHMYKNQKRRKHNYLNKQVNRR